jgi:hypothetical protein
MRRLGAALTGLAESTANADRAEAVKKYLLLLDLAIERSPFDAEDRAMAHREGRQRIGLSRRPGEPIGTRNCGSARRWRHGRCKRREPMPAGMG